MVQQCEKMVLDERIDIGPVGMSHVWIDIEGPREELAPLAGTSRTLPTRYRYILPHQLDSQWAHVFLQFAGIDSQLVETISLGRDQSGTSAGEVIEEPALEAKYAWTEISKLDTAPDIVTSSHRFYRKYGIRESSADAKCLAQVLGDGEVELDATSNSVIGELGFGTSFTGFSNPGWVEHCHIDYRVDYFP